MSDADRARWDALTDPCDLSVEPYEQISMWQVAAGGDIKLLNKIFLDLIPLQPNIGSHVPSVALKRAE